jgi:2-dehydropantoate 2-reductase
MRFAIVGAGATGGYLGACLARAGADVVLVARGPHLTAMRERGLTVREPDGREFQARPEATEDLESAVASAEAVFVTLKAHSLPGVAPRLGRSLRAGATVVTAQNGVPWWYFGRGYRGPLAGERVAAVDPDGVIGRSIPEAAVVAAIVYPATSLVAPGVVEHVEGNRFSLGELDGGRTERVLAISRALSEAGLKAPVQARIRGEIWLKLLGNASFNPVSALGRVTLGQMATVAGARDLVRVLMEEVEAVARAVGEEMAIPIERRLEGGFKVAEHRTSMLQDVEAGRPLEVDALLGSVCEIGDRLDVPVPQLHTVLTLCRLLDRSREKP